MCVVECRTADRHTIHSRPCRRFFPPSFPFFFFLSLSLSLFHSFPPFAFYSDSLSLSHTHTHTLSFFFSLSPTYDSLPLARVSPAGASRCRHTTTFATTTTTTMTTTTLATIGPSRWPTREARQKSRVASLMFFSRVLVFEKHAALNEPSAMIFFFSLSLSLPPRWHGEGNASVYARPVARADCPPAPGTADGNRVQCLLYRVSFFKHQPAIRILSSSIPFNLAVPLPRFYEDIPCSPFSY